MLYIQVRCKASKAADIVFYFKAFDFRPSTFDKF